MKICLRCDCVRWVCEAHPDRPWSDGPRGCSCGAPGEPCPFCNRSDGKTLPAMPAGFVPDEERSFDLDGFDEHDASVAKEALARLVRFSRPKH